METRDMIVVDVPREDHSIDDLIDDPQAYFAQVRAEAENSAATAARLYVTYSPPDVSFFVHTLMKLLH